METICNCNNQYTKQGSNYTINKKENEEQKIILFFLEQSQNWIIKKFFIF